ncbi:MAG: hypothetical protein A2283_07425 [Lentisphaerae bacterium RIFOXYA12_FULL_48_11]|nr:MAG: hypothetical protein A2283_07425 [Lentisphaerae bacterium RIFOXYA12_FULL_48_11]
MRYAIISDIHANLQAFEAVLADISVQNIDSIVCLGDAVGYGTQPVEVLNVVRETVHVMLMGNHDAAVVDLMDTSDFSDGALLSIASTKPLLDDSITEYLESLPYGYTVSEFACAHANLVNPESYNYVQTIEDAVLSFKARTEQLLFVGHTHAPAVFLMDPEGSCSKLSADGFIVLHSCRYLINPGSVGMPRTKDLRATYCIFDTMEKRVSFRRVGYDVQAFRKMIEKDAKSSEQIAYVLNLLDSHMLPARKTSKDVSSPAVRKIREAAMAARKAKREKKPSGQSAGGASMFLDDAALKSIQTAPSNKKRKVAKNEPVKTWKSSRWLVVVIACLLVVGMAFGIVAYKMKGHSEALSDYQQLPPGLEKAAEIVLQEPMPGQDVEKQVGATNRGPVRFENLSLIHRWSFSNNLADTEGGSNAEIVEVGPNDVKMEAGQVIITGGARGKSDYVSLGSGLLAGKTGPITIELWARQISVKKWGRIFDFGNGEKNGLMMAWTIEKDLNKDKIEWQDSNGSAAVDSSNKYALGKEYHIVMVVEPKTGTDKKTLVTWYSAPSEKVELGEAKGKLRTASTLAKLVDAHDNLGRSFYDGDETANAAYNEVRIWDGAASWTVAEMLHKLGPDVVFK